MSDEVKFIDAEFQTSGNEKIDFRIILMKQIDYIRFLRVQDMGENALFELGINNLSKGEKFFIWTSNAQKYQNSVKALKTLLINYHDSEYIEDLKTINNKYDLMLKQELKQVKNICIKQKKKESEYWEMVKTSKRTFVLLNNNNKYDEILEATLKLTQRAKFLGGNDTIEEIM